VTDSGDIGGGHRPPLQARAAASSCPFAAKERTERKAETTQALISAFFVPQ
jgi:hypothetical protein